MVIVVAPRIPQSGPEDNTEVEQWAKKLNRLEGEGHRGEIHRMYSNFNVTCNRPFHDPQSLEDNSPGTRPRDSSNTPPPRPPSPVDDDNCGEPRGQRPSFFGRHFQEDQDGSSSWPGKDHRHEMGKHHRGHPHGGPPGCFGHHRPHGPPPHHWDRFGFGKPFHRPLGPPPCFDFPKHGPPRHHGPPHHPKHHGPPPPFHHRDHHGSPHNPPPPPPPPPHHYDHHGSMHHAPGHHKHHGPPPLPHHFNRHGPPHHGRNGHGHPRHGRRDETFGTWYDFEDEKHRAGHGPRKDIETHHATGRFAE